MPFLCQTYKRMVILYFHCHAHIRNLILEFTFRVFERKIWFSIVLLYDQTIFFRWKFPIRRWECVYLYSWWRHQIETFFALLAICAGNLPFTVNSPHKGQRRGASIFSLIFAWTNGWVNNGEAGDFRRHRAHPDVAVMLSIVMIWPWKWATLS